MEEQFVTLSVDHIVELHGWPSLSAMAGVRAFVRTTCLRPPLLQPYQSLFGEDAYRTVPEKAAAHAFFIAENQPFVDGNKRTAALALAVFLDLNGYDLLEAHETELADILIALGSGEIDQGRFFTWVCGRAHPRG